MQFGHCYLGSKGLQKSCNKLELNKVVGEASEKLRFVQELEFWQSLLLFFVGTSKKQRAIKIKCDQTHFKSVLGHHASYRKKLSKKLLEWANLVLQKEPRKESFPWDLGFFWEANEICTFLAEFKYLKNEKRNYLMRKF